jgi:uncharacterized membrane protein YfcA
VTVGPGIVAALMVAAFTAGFVDAVAGGGGLLTMPSLMIAGFPMHSALAINKGQSVWGAISSAISYWRGGAIDGRRGLVAFPAALGGSLVGTWLVLTVRPEPLRPIVIALLVLAIVLVAVPKDRIPRVEWRRPLVVWATIGLVLGFYDGFFGPGTGTILIALHRSVFRSSMAEASADSKVANLAAFATFALTGSILWSVALPMALANTIGAAVGARTAIRRGDTFIRNVLLVVVAGLVVKVSVDLLRH